MEWKNDLDTLRREKNKAHLEWRKASKDDANYDTRVRGKYITLRIPHEQLSQRFEEQLQSLKEEKSMLQAEAEKASDKERKENLAKLVRARMRWINQLELILEEERETLLTDKTNGQPIPPRDAVAKEMRKKQELRDQAKQKFEERKQEYMERAGVPMEFRAHCETQSGENGKTHFYFGGEKEPDGQGKHGHYMLTPEGDAVRLREPELLPELMPEPQEEAPEEAPMPQMPLPQAPQDIPEQPAPLPEAPAQPDHQWVSLQWLYDPDRGYIMGFPPAPQMPQAAPNLPPMPEPPQPQWFFNPYWQCMTPYPPPMPCQQPWQDQQN